MWPPQSAVHPPWSGVEASLPQYQPFQGAYIGGPSALPDVPARPVGRRTLNSNDVPLKEYQRSQFYKTRFCPHHQANGGCRKADECNYAHEEVELRPSVNLTKTKLCQEFMHGGCTNHLDCCPFAHGTEELRSTSGFYKTQLCKFWTIGNCPAGSQCRHAHGEGECRVRNGSAQKLSGLSSVRAISNALSPDPMLCPHPQITPPPPPPDRVFAAPRQVHGRVAGFLGHFLSSQQPGFSPRAPGDFVSTLPSQLHSHNATLRDNRIVEVGFPSYPSVSHPPNNLPWPNPPPPPEPPLEVNRFPHRAADGHVGALCVGHSGNCTTERNANSASVNAGRKCWTNGTPPLEWPPVERTATFSFTPLTIMKSDIIRTQRLSSDLMSGSGSESSRHRKRNMRESCLGCKSCSKPDSSAGLWIPEISPRSATSSRESFRARRRGMSSDLDQMLESRIVSQLTPYAVAAAAREIGAVSEECGTSQLFSAQLHEELNATEDLASSDSAKSSPRESRLPISRIPCGRSVEVLALSSDGSPSNLKSADTSPTISNYSSKAGQSDSSLGTPDVITPLSSYTPPLTAPPADWLSRFPDSSSTMAASPALGPSTGKWPRSSSNRSNDHVSSSVSDCGSSSTRSTTEGVSMSDILKPSNNAKALVPFSTKHGSQPRLDSSPVSECLLNVSAGSMTKSPSCPQLPQTGTVPAPFSGTRILTSPSPPNGVAELLPLDPTTSALNLFGPSSSLDTAFMQFLSLPPLAQKHVTESAAYCLQYISLQALAAASGTAEVNAAGVASENPSGSQPPSILTSAGMHSLDAVSPFALDVHSSALTQSSVDQFDTDTVTDESTLASQAVSADPLMVAAVAVAASTNALKYLVALAGEEGTDETCGSEEEQLASPSSSASPITTELPLITSTPLPPLARETCCSIQPMTDYTLLPQPSDSLNNTSSIGLPKFTDGPAFHRAHPLQTRAGNSTFRSCPTPQNFPFSCKRPAHLPFRWSPSPVSVPPPPPPPPRRRPPPPPPCTPLFSSQITAAVRNPSASSSTNP